MSYALQSVLTNAIIFGTVFGILFLYLRNQHKQRMLMIEKGVFELKKSEIDPKRGLMIAIMLLLAVLGAVIGWIMYSAIPMFKGTPIFLIIPLGFIAVGYMVYYYFFVYKKEKK